MGDHIWCGSPYDCSLEVYDLQGNLVGRPNGLHPNGLKSSELTADILQDPREVSRLMTRRITNKNLLPHEPLVFRILSNPINAVSYDIYDTHGRVLKKGLHPGKGGLQLMDSSNGVLSGVKTLLNGLPPNKLDWRLFFTRAEFENAKNAGLQLETDQGRHFLWVGRLKHPS